jgi:hypothetical protein
MIMMTVWCREEENDDDKEEVHCDSDNMKGFILLLMIVKMIMK